MRYIRNPITGLELEVPEVGDVFKKNSSGELFKVLDVRKHANSKRVYVLLSFETGKEYGAFPETLNRMHYIGRDV